MRVKIKNKAHPSIKVVTCGISGTGKTTLLEKLIRKEKYRRTVIYDHKGGDFSERFGVPPCYDFGELYAALERGGLAIFDYSRNYPGKKEEGFTDFCEFFWDVCRELPGKKALVTDELDELIDARTEPGALTTILDVGREYQMDFFGIAQSMNAVHNQVRKQITEVFAFMQGDERGKEWLIKERGFDVEKLNALKYGQWLYFNKLTGERAEGGESFVPKNSTRDLSGL